MVGRGLLIAAAILQLSAAGIVLFASLLTTMLPIFASNRDAFVAMTLIGSLLTVVGLLVAASIALMRMRPWGWYVSIAMTGLSAVALVALPLAGRVGLGEMIILAALVGVPLCVNIGLLVGGRRAVFAAKPKTAAEPMVVTPRVG